MRGERPAYRNRTSPYYKYQLLNWAPIDAINVGTQLHFKLITVINFLYDRYSGTILRYDKVVNVQFTRSLS